MSDEKPKSALDHFKGSGNDSKLSHHPPTYPLGRVKNAKSAGREMARSMQEMQRRNEAYKQEFSIFWKDLDDTEKQAFQAYETTAHSVGILDNSEIMRSWKTMNDVRRANSAAEAAGEALQEMPMPELYRDLIVRTAGRELAKKTPLERFLSVKNGEPETPRPDLDAEMNRRIVRNADYLRQEMERSPQQRWREKELAREKTRDRGFDMDF